VAEVEGQVVADGDDRYDAEAEARRRLALAQIRQYPDPVLRMRANEVETFDEELARLAERMTALMHDAHGVGLAATQVGVLRRLFVFSDDDVDHVLVNPRIVESGGMVETDEEGCLSLGPVRVPVERSLEITVEAQDVTGAPVRLELECMAARVVQHELDHLDGVLIVQRTDDASRREALAQLRPQPIIGVG
jgi:peptide deformylase